MTLVLYRFVTQSNSQYPLKPLPSQKKRILVESPYPDLCILLAITGAGIVHYRIRSLESVTTVSHMVDFVKVVLNKHSSLEEGESLFYAFDAAPAEVADALSKVVSDHGNERKAFFIPPMVPAGNPVNDLLQNHLYKVDRKPLESNRNENIDSRVESALESITPEMCRRYIKVAVADDTE